MKRDGDSSSIGEKRVRKKERIKSSEMKEKKK